MLLLSLYALGLPVAAGCLYRVFLDVWARDCMVGGRRPNMEGVVWAILAGLTAALFWPLLLLAWFLAGRPTE